jgi:hypothetical protein
MRHALHDYVISNEAGHMDMPTLRKESDWIEAQSHDGALRTVQSALRMFRAGDVAHRQLESYQRNMERKEEAAA